MFKSRFEIDSDDLVLDSNDARVDRRKIIGFDGVVKNHQHSKEGE